MEDWTPSPSDVGSVIRARTVDTNSRELGTFTSDTRPTDVELTDLIETAVSDVRSETGTIPDKHMQLARRVSAIGAALMVELTYFPEETATGQGPYNQLEKLYEKLLARLVKGVLEDDGNDSTDDTSLLPMDSFGDNCGLVGMNTRF